MIDIKELLLRNMTTKELNNTLREEARFLGLCDEWYNAWREYSLDELAARMYKGIDFCLKHHWPSNDFIAKNFQKDFLRSNGIFVDDEYSTSNIEHSLVLGSSHIRYRYSGKSYGNINLRDTSYAHITTRGNVLLVVHMFETSSIKVEQSENARVVVIKHSPKVIINRTGDVTVKEEYDYLR